MQLEGSVALITGGSGGIGAGLARSFARAGANVAVADLLRITAVREAADTLQAELEASGRSCVLLDCDVTDGSQVGSAVRDTIRHLGRLDVTCANAGIARSGRVQEMSLEQWREVIDVNLTGTFLTCQAAAAHMTQQRRGAIIVTSSVAAHRGGDGYSAYCASKSALLGFTRSLAVELAPFNVRANVISPGYLATTMWLEDILGGERRGEQFDAVISQAVPLGRPQIPADLGDAAVYLATAENVTGAELVIDGGHLAGP